MLIAAILVKATSPGPVIYKQTRITLDQREFSILKFRTMSATAEAKSGPVLSTSNDSRVTTVGKYLRALRIDELPQLINVIRGICPLSDHVLNDHSLLINLIRKTRITIYVTMYVWDYWLCPSLWKYASDYNSKLNFDLLYIKNYSLLLDMKILLQTIKILFDKVSSRGLDESEEREELTMDYCKENAIRIYR